MIIITIILIIITIVVIMIILIILILILILIGILAKPPRKLPDLEYDKTIKKEYAKPLPYDNDNSDSNSNSNNVKKKKTSNEYNGTIILIMYDKRQDLSGSMRDEFLKHHENPDRY